MAKEPKKAPDAASQVVAAQIDAYMEVGPETTTVAGFLQNIGPFFLKARELEQEAVALRTESRGWLLPTTPEEDEVLVANIRRSNDVRKRIADHWAARNVFHALHKKLVAAFSRADSPAEAAQKDGNDLHNRFVANQREAARKIEEQRRREEYEREQTRLREEADRLEQEAIAREAAQQDLSEREQSFVRLVADLGDAHALQAASAAGYKDPSTMAPRLLTYQKVRAAITAAREAKTLRAQAEAVKAAPVAINDVTVRPEITTSAGVTTSRVEVVDEEAFIAAVVSGKYGVPTSVLTYKQSQVSDLGKTMGVLVERIPGLRLVKNTKVRG